MVYGQLAMVFLAVIFLYLAVTVFLPPILIGAINLLLIVLAGWQAHERWVHKAHYWYEMGILFAFLVVMFYPNILPFWWITNFCVLAVAFAETLQFIERKTN